jgi:hypothetical protein
MMLMRCRWSTLRYLGGEGPNCPQLPPHQPSQGDSLATSTWSPPQGVHGWQSRRSLRLNLVLRSLA